MAKFLVLHGPNLNLLGSREPEQYGRATLAEINEKLQNQARHAKHELVAKQSNSEADLINWIHEAQGQYAFIIINPAAFTHTSIALRDALLAVGIPFIEIHLSNIYKREAFRQHSYFSDAAIGLITGFGAKGYLLALAAAIEHITEKN